MLPIKMDAGESKEIYVFHTKDGARRSLTGALIEVSLRRSRDDEEPLVTKTLSDGIVLADDEMSALCTIAPADTDADARGSWLVYVDIRWESGPVVTERYIQTAHLTIS